MSETGKPERSGSEVAHEAQQESIISISMIGPTAVETKDGLTFAYQAVAVRRLPGEQITESHSPYPIFATILPESLTREVEEAGKRIEVATPGSRVAAFSSFESGSNVPEWKLRSMHYEEKFFPPLDNEASRNEAVKRAVGIVAQALFPVQLGTAIEIISEKQSQTPQNS